VLAQFGAGNAILAAALKRIKILDFGKNGSELYDLTGKIIANPTMASAISQRSVADGAISTERRSPVRTRFSNTISGPPHSPAPATVPKASNTARSGVSRSRQAVGVPAGTPRGSTVGSDEGRAGDGRGNGTVLPAVHSTDITTIAANLSPNFKTPTLGAF
jgi:hypothetical protein